MTEVHMGEGPVTTSEKIQAALLGAAAGDALGWPQEQRGGRVGGRGPVAPNLIFREWTRRAGGRFLSHEEIIKAGEYSDDTQLLICTARSILQRKAWLQRFVQSELPTWGIYQRGGGGATKRAVEAWASGKCPWAEAVGEQDRRRYFQAGGNGVAMRIMPHVAVSGSLINYHPLKLAILLNGIATHGHPRALIGAAVYGYVAWVALRNSATLPYGMLVEAALENRDEWATLPNVQFLPEEWSRLARRSFDTELEIVWERTAREMVDLLTKVHRGIRSGALAIDEEVLRGLGCFDSAVSGAGTVSAAGAIYLASKYAPDPSHGLIGAAFAKGADTDTLASMTGGILGLVSGMEWLQGATHSLEDSAYLQDLASRLASICLDEFEVNKIEARDRSADLKRFIADIETADSGQHIRIPDGREGTILQTDSVATKSKSLSGRSWTVRTDDGQTLHVKKLRRSLSGMQRQLGFREPMPAAPISSVQAIKVRVAELLQARRFYAEVLGLAIARESKNAINFGGVLTLVPANYDTGFLNGILGQSIVCVETTDLELCRERVLQAGTKGVTPVEQRTGRRFFACLDFDGNIVEVFERAPAGDKDRELQPTTPN